ncbi:tetratricopeptide repeat protein, partial [candidate division TA06 bacterium]
MEESSVDKIRKLSETLAKNPDSLVFASLAGLYLEQQMIGQAIKMCLSGLKYHPNYLNGHRVLAEAYLAKKMVHSAKGEYERILELNPNDEAVRTKLEML